MQNETNMNTQTRISKVESEREIPYVINSSTK